MKNITKSILTLLLLFITSISFAQNKSISAKKVGDAIEITTTENGKSISKIVDISAAKQYFEEIGGDIDVNLEELGDNIYQLKYKTENGVSETVEIDIAEMMENLSISFESLGDDLESMIENISSQIEYEETTDEDGNTVIKVKSLNVEK